MGVATSGEEGRAHQTAHKPFSAFQAACVYSDIDTTKVDVGAFASKIRAAQQRIPATNAKIVHRIVDSHDCYVRSLVWDPFRDFLISGGGDGWIRIWKTSDYSFVGELDSKLSVRSLLVLTQELVSGHSNGEVILWSLEDPARSIYQRLQAHEEAVYALVTLRSGELVSGAEDIRIFSRGFFGYSHMLTIAEEVLCMCTIPSSTSVITGNMNSMMLVWETTQSCEHWDLMAECTGHRRSVWSLAYIRDTAKVASGSADHSIRIWNILSWECEITLEDHTGWVVGLSCSPGAIVSCSIDQGVRLWDCWTWECERTFCDQEYEVYCVCTFDGGRFATGGAEMSILIYGGPEHDKPHTGHGGTAFPGLSRNAEVPGSGPTATMPRSMSPRGQEQRAPSTWASTTRTEPPKSPRSGYDWMALPEWVTAPITSMREGLSPRNASKSSHATHPTGQDLFPEPREKEEPPPKPLPNLGQKKERRRELQAMTSELDFTMSDFRRHIAEVEAEAAMKKDAKKSGVRGDSPKESLLVEVPRTRSPSPERGGHAVESTDSPQFGKSSKKVGFSPDDDMLFDTWTAVPTDKDLGLKPKKTNEEGITEWSSALLSRGRPS